MNEIAQNPLVSIIIPTYNRAWILKDAIESVLCQDFTDFELIVVDDGSSDQTKALVKACQTVRYVFQENKGVSAARNRGVKDAKGKYVAFLDSDDMWLQKKLSTQIRFFMENPSASICQTEEIWIRNGVRVNPKLRHKKPSGMIFEPSLELCLVSPSAVMLEKRFLEEMGGFDESLPACEDYDLWLRISARYPIYLIDDPLIIKKGGHSDQLSKAPGLDKFRIYALEKILKSDLLSPSQRRSAINMLHIKCEIYANGCKKRGKHTEAAYFLQLANQYIF